MAHTRSMTLIDALLARSVRPRSSALLLFEWAVLCITGSAVVGLCAQLEVRLPFSPVPITGQTFAVLLIGAAYGARLGAATLILYILEGCAGLPVFAGGGAGFVHLAGPTGGYLIGFVLAAGATGYLAQRGWDRSFFFAFAAMLIGTCALFAPGVVWLAGFVPPKAALMMGLVPFVPGAIIKMTLAAVLLPTAWRVVRRLQTLCGRL